MELTTGYHKQLMCPVCGSPNNTHAGTGVMEDGAYSICAYCGTVAQLKGNVLEVLTHIQLFALLSLEPRMRKMMAAVAQMLADANPERTTQDS